MTRAQRQLGHACSQRCKTLFRTPRLAYGWLCLCMQAADGCQHSCGGSEGVWGWGRGEGEMLHLHQSSASAVAALMGLGITDL